jgi:hypothetical protein
MQINPSHNPLIPYGTNPKGWTRSNGELTLRGKIAATGYEIASKIGEAFYYTGLAVEALGDHSPLPLGEEIHRLDVQRRALRAQRRVTTTENLPVGQANPLKDLPAAHIKRPVMLVPGWDTPHDRFLPLTDKLTERGANGGTPYYVKNGQFFRDRDCDEALPAAQLPKDAKVFVTVLNSTSESPHTSAPELQANLQAMQQALGGPAPDVIAYSQGGLCTRTVLDHEGSHIGKLLFVGTPNKGAGLASLASFVFKAQEDGYDVDWLLHSLDLDPEDRASMQFMTVGGPDISDLNARWSQQMERTEGFMVVGYKGAQTYNYGFPPLVPGDTLVPAENLAPAGVQPAFIDGAYAKHGTLPFNAGVYQQMLKHFSWA